MATYELVPQHLVAQRVLYYDHTELPAPICRVHKNNDILILRYYALVPHRLETVPNCLCANAVLGRKLFQCLLPVNVITLNAVWVKAFTSYELAITRLAFI